MSEGDNGRSRILLVSGLTVVIVLDRLTGVVVMVGVPVVADVKVIVEEMQAVAEVKVEVVETGEWDVSYDQRRNGCEHD